MNNTPPVNAVVAARSTQLMIVSGITVPLP